MTKPKAILLDIEGTISSLPYVVKTFYPYTRRHLPDFVASRRGEPVIEAALEDTRALAGAGRDPVEALLQWIDEDRKAPPLKLLQGLIWEKGYERGELAGHIYDDALAVLTRWQAAGLPLHIYSSGSVQCQVQFYQHSAKGDLRHLFTRHFDTAIGAKVEADSYRRIAAALDLAPADLLFFTDNARELEAASSVGLAVVQVVRENAEADGRFPYIFSFHEIERDIAA